jgi:NodT family efflux transporter outer membrane factor (OMF) lipoprotein
MVKFAFPTLASALLAACAVGPDHVRPDMAVPGAFAHAATLDVGPADVSEPEFWRRFDDPLLSRLVDDALTANHDLRIGLARWDQARALLRQSRMDQLPTVTANASAASGRSSAAQLPGLDRQARDADRFDAGIDALWELDFFGRVRRQVQAQVAQSSAAAEDLRTLQVAIVSELATSYLRLRGLQERLRVAGDNSDNQLESLRVVDARLDAGQGTEFDTSRARAQLAATQARIPALESAAAMDMHRIAVLTGRTPETLLDELGEVRAVPVPADAIDPGTPADLLRRRPDIAAAEHRLAGATARIGIATADLFPRITLGGAFGTQALASDALFERDSETRLLSLGIDWSFLDVGRVRARIAAAQAGADEQLASYQQTVLRALEETENAFVLHRNRRRETAYLAEAAAAGARATDLARVQFDGGLVEFLQVLDAERIQLDAEDRLAQSRADAAIALVDVYRAMAGGWPDRLPARPDALALRAD